MQAALGEVGGTDSLAPIGNAFQYEEIGGYVAWTCRVGDRIGHQFPTFVKYHSRLITKFVLERAQVCLLDEEPCRAFRWTPYLSSHKRGIFAERRPRGALPLNK
jgi:hypothetical protein